MRFQSRIRTRSGRHIDMSYPCTYGCLDFAANHTAPWPYLIRNKAYSATSKSKGSSVHHSRNFVFGVSSTIEPRGTEQAFPGLSSIAWYSERVRGHPDLLNSIPWRPCHKTRNKPRMRAEQINIEDHSNIYTIERPMYWNPSLYRFWLQSFWQLVDYLDNQKSNHARMPLKLCSLAYPGDGQL